jgi:glycosyltransferase involved in cell wall biosynthesis
LNSNIECKVFKKSSRFDILFLKKITDFLNANIYDGLIVFLFIPSFYSLLIKPFIKYKLKYILSERSYEGATNFFHKKVIRSFYSSADFITTNSITQTNVLLNKHPKLSPKIRHISNGLDLDKFYFVNKKKSETPLLLAVGSVYRVKNVLFLIEALNVLKKIIINLSFHGWVSIVKPILILLNVTID